MTRLEEVQYLRTERDARHYNCAQSLLVPFASEVGLTKEQADALVIRGREKLPGGVTVSGHNDHRIAMMAAIAATNCDAPVTITGAECVKKSYPNFWEDYEALGGVIARAQA